MDYRTRTRQDWIDFDNARSEAFKPTQEEIEQQKQVEEQNKINLINSKLHSRGITLPSTITKQWMLGALEGLNAKAFVGDDVEGWLDGQIELYGDMRSALNNLVLTYL